MKKIFIADFKENEPVESAFLVNQKSLLTSKANRPYLSVKLSDASGEIEARIWDNVEAMAKGFDKNDFVYVAGRAIVYQEKMQLNVIKIVRLKPEEVNIADFLPVSPFDRPQMMRELVDLIQSEVKNPWILKLLLSIIQDPLIAQKFERAPAAKTNHHAWIGGLLQHVLYLCKLARDVLKHYPMVSADLVYTGLILHDMGKIDELSYDRSFGYTDDGQLVGHLIQGVEMVYDKIRAIPDFPAKLKTHVIHLILAHHGQLEYGSPKLPMTLEAIMVHYLDDLDSKIQGMLDLSAKEADPKSPWIGFNRLFGRPMYRATLKDLEESVKE